VTPAHARYGGDGTLTGGLSLLTAAADAVLLTILIASLDET
jgi:hypothetical protein